MPRAPKIKQTTNSAQDGPIPKKPKYVEGTQDILELAQLAANASGEKTKNKLEKQKSRTRKDSKMDAMSAKLSGKSKSPLEAAKDRLANNKPQPSKAKAKPTKVSTETASATKPKKGVKFAS